MRGFTKDVVTHQSTIEAYGVQLRVCTNSAELMESVEPFLPPRSRRVAHNPDAHPIGIIAEEDGTFSVYTGSNRVCEEGPRELAMIHIDDQLRSYVALNAPERVFVHAGVVAVDGRALVIPGDSFAGKSTLVEALVRRGALYYSDEFAVFDSEGLVHPFPQRLTLRRFQQEGQYWSGDRAVEELGGVAGEEPLPLGLTVVTFYVPGAEWRPRRLSHGEATLALMARAVPARYRPEKTLQLLSNAVRDAVVLEGERGEADEFAEMLLQGAVV
jgi:hypothetical protein